MMNEKWHDRFFTMAKEVSCWSKDPLKKVGAVIVKDKRVLATGYNGFPCGIADLSSRLQNQGTKRSLVIHAELNAILNAGKHGVSTEGATLYVTFPPCSRCSLYIIQSGIAYVVAPKVDENSGWFQSQYQALEYLKEAGVGYKLF